MNSGTFDVVAKILVNDFHLAALQVTPQTPLLALELDSLALMEFVFAVEDAFALRIPQERLDPRDAGITLHQLCDVVDEMVAVPTGTEKGFA